MDRLDGIFRKKIDQARPHTPRPDWDRMAAQLEEKDRRVVGWYWRRGLWAALILLLVAAGWGSHALYEAYTLPSEATAMHIPTPESALFAETAEDCPPPAKQMETPTGANSKLAFSPSTSSSKSINPPQIPGDQNIEQFPVERRIEDAAAIAGTPPTSADRAVAAVQHPFVGATPQETPVPEKRAPTPLPEQKAPLRDIASIQPVPTQAFEGEFTPIQNPSVAALSVDVPESRTSLAARMGFGDPEGWRKRQWQLTVFGSMTRAPLGTPSIYGPHPGVGVSLDRRISRRWALGLQAERIQWWLPAYIPAFEFVNTATGSPEYGLIDYWGYGTTVHGFGRYYLKGDRNRRWQPYLVGGIGMHASTWQGLEVSSPYESRDDLQTALDPGGAFGFNRVEPLASQSLTNVVYGENSKLTLAQAYGGVGLQVRIWKRFSLSWESTIHTQWQLNIQNAQADFLTPNAGSQDQLSEENIPGVPSIPAYLSHRLGIRISF